METEKKASADTVKNVKDTKVKEGFKQLFENLPPALLADPRYFQLYGNAKDATPKGWNKTENQKLYTAFDGNKLLGLDLSGHGIRDDFLCYDFDDCLKAGEFICNSAKNLFNTIITKFPKIYIEYSQSGNGLHIFFKPTAGIFGTLAGGANATLYFTESKEKGAPKLEIFYKQNARYFLVTGHPFGLYTGKEIPEGAEVDEFLKSILKKIDPQQPKKAKVTAPLREKKNYNAPPEYRRDLSIACAKFCNFADLPNTEWLPYFTALVNEGFSLEELRGLCCDSSRYNEKEFDAQYKWALDKPTFGVKTLIGKAQQAGFIVKEYYKTWCNDHPSLAVDDFDDLSLTKEEEILFWKQELQEVDNLTVDFEKEKTDSISKIQNIIQNEISFDKDLIFADDILMAAAFCKKFEPVTFAKFKSAVQIQAKKQNESFLRLWDTQINSAVKDIEKRYSQLQAKKNFILAKIASLYFFLNNDILKNFDIPDGYKIEDSGIDKVVGEKSFTVCPRPIAIVNEVFDTETHFTKWILAYKSNTGHWVKIPAQDAEIISKPFKIPILSRHKFPVNGVNSARVVEFLSDFSWTNENKFPLIHTVPNCGWYEYRNNKYFIDPRRENFSTNEFGKEIEIIVDTEKFILAKFLSTSGTLDQWKNAYNLAKISPVARLTVAASVAPALLEIISERNFIQYTHGATHGGKTTAMLLSASAVGKAEKLVRTFDGSPTALTALAAENTDYATFIDERQAGGKDPTEIKSLIYSISNGMEKTRAAIDGKVRDSRDYQTIALINGEVEFVPDNATGGAWTRTLSISAPNVILDENTCKNIREVIKENYGVVFPLFINKICSMNADLIKENYNKLCDILADKDKKNLVLSEHRRYLAILTLADSMLNNLLGESQKTAEESALLNADKIFELIPTKAEISDTQREKDFVFSYITQNQNNFLQNSAEDSKIKNVLGKFADDYVYILASALKQDCETAGYNYNKLVKELIENQFFIPNDTVEKGRKKPRPTVLRRLDKGPAPCLRIQNKFWKTSEV